MKLKNSLSCFQSGSFKFERSVLSWKEPFEVEKLKTNLETIAKIGKKKVKLETNRLSWKAVTEVGKIGYYDRIKVTKIIYLNVVILTHFGAFLTPVMLF